VSGDPGYLVSNPSVQAAAAAVPQPGSFALLGLGLAAVWLGRRRNAPLSTGAWNELSGGCDPCWRSQRKIERRHELIHIDGFGQIA
jgi:hypothetical protein